MKTRRRLLSPTALLLLVPMAAIVQAKSGSDGAFNPKTNTVINMADHPDAIYQYTSVDIPSSLTVRLC